MTDDQAKRRELRIEEAIMPENTCPHGVDLNLAVCHRCDGTAIYTEEQLQAYLTAEREELLDDLIRKSKHYTPDGLVADALDPWAVSVAELQRRKEEDLQKP